MDSAPLSRLMVFWVESLLGLSCAALTLHEVGRDV